MATKKTSAPKKPLDAKTADRLLDLLSTDTAFRRTFKSSPTAALVSLGHAEAAGTAVCAPVKAIAPKQEFAAAREALRAHLTTAGIFTNPHCFEAGTVTSRSRRK